MFRTTHFYSNLRSQNSLIIEHRTFHPGKNVSRMWPFCSFKVFQRLQRDHCAALGCPWSVHVCKYSMLLSQHVSRLYVFWWQQYTHVSCTTTAHKATTWRAAKTSEKNMKFHIFFLFEEMTVLQEWLDLFEKSHIAFAAACDHPPNNLWIYILESIMIK